MADVVSVHTVQSHTYTYTQTLLVALQTVEVAAGVAGGLGQRARELGASLRPHVIVTLVLLSMLVRIAVDVSCTW